MIQYPQNYAKHTLAPTPTSSPDNARGSGAESPIVGLVPSMAATTKPPEIRPSTDTASSRFPRAAPCMKPEMPKVSLLRDRSACAGRARPTPPRKDWRGVGPGPGIEGEEVGVRGERASETFFENVKEREMIYDDTVHLTALFGSILDHRPRVLFSRKTVTTFGI